MTQITHSLCAPPRPPRRQSRSFAPSRATSQFTCSSPRTMHRFVQTQRHCLPHSQPTPRARLCLPQPARIIPAPPFLASTRVFSESKIDRREHSAAAQNARARLRQLLQSSRREHANPSQPRRLLRLVKHILRQLQHLQTRHRDDRRPWRRPRHPRNHSRNLASSVLRKGSTILLLSTEAQIGRQRQGAKSLPACETKRDDGKDPPTPRSTCATRLLDTA